MPATSTYCECCWTAAVKKSVSDFQSKFCQQCRSHLHDPNKLRADHRSTVDALHDRHLREIAGVRARIASGDEMAESAKAERDQLVSTIATDFAESPSEGLVKLIRSAVISELQEKETQAYKTRDRAMAALWQVTEYHRPTLTEKCKCGLALSGCREYNALEFIWDTYDRWVRREIERMEAGKHHGLPADHPAAQRHFTDPSRWKGARPTQPDHYRVRIA